LNGFSRLGNLWGGLFGFGKREYIAIGVTFIFVSLTLLIWQRLLHPLERAGWASGFVMLAIMIIAWLMGEIPFQWKALFSVVALVILGVTAFWTRIRGPKPPKLMVKRAELSPEEEPREIRVRFRNGQEKSHEARFFFVTVENVEGKRIKGLRPCVYLHYNMLIVSPYGKPLINVDYQGSLREFEQKGLQAYLDALMNNGKKAKKSISFPPDRRASVTFALFLTLKDYPWLHIPADTKRYHPIPSKFRIELAFRTEDLLPYHVATYEINAQTWDKIDVKEVTSDKS